MALCGLKGIKRRSLYLIWLDIPIQGKALFIFFAVKMKKTNVRVLLGQSTIGLLLKVLSLAMNGRDYITRVKPAVWLLYYIPLACSNTWLIVF